MTHTDSDTPATPATLRLDDPSSLLAGLPFLVGFHPEDSFVILVLQDSHVKVTARVAIDVPARALAAKFTDVCAVHEGDALLLIAYAEDERTGRTAMTGLLDALTSVPVAEALIADGSRWWSALCDESCCPAEGTPYDLTSHRVTAEGVLAGAAPLASRNALRATVAGPSDADRTVAEGLFEDALLELAELELQDRSDRMAMMVEDYCVHERALTPRQCAELAVLAYDATVRDIAAERIRSEDAPTHVELWRQVVRQAIEPFECAPLCLLALAAWVSGRGALQVVCMERVEQINSGYSLLHVLEEINTRCLPPSVWGEIRGNAG